MIDKILKENNLDAILLTDYYNKRFLTGFTGTTGIALAGYGKEKYFYSDMRYKIQGEKQVTPYGFTFVNAGKMLLKEAAEYAKKMNVKKMGIDEDDLNLASFNQIKELFEGVELVLIAKNLKELRIVKSEEEVENLRRACEISDIAFREVLKVIKVGMTEKEIAAYIEYIQRLNGAENRSFDTIVASGVRSSMPHGVASEKKIGKNEFITMDFGCYYNGYASDMTRTIYIGEISEEEKRIYNLVYEANQLGISLTKEGVVAGDIAKAVRAYLKEHDAEQYFTHSLGHGYGLEVHEAPAVSKISDVVLKENMAITIEPGIYIENKYGVRIEDDLIVKKDGYELITKSPRHLIILGSE